MLKYFAVLKMGTQRVLEKVHLHPLVNKLKILTDIQCLNYFKISTTYLVYFDFLISLVKNTSLVAVSDRLFSAMSLSHSSTNDIIYTFVGYLALF